MKRITMTLWLAFALSLANGGAVADVKKWIGPDGGVHYGRWAPPGAQAAAVKVRPNIIETHQDLPPEALRTQNAPALKTPEAVSGVQPYPRSDIRAYVEQCKQNRGVDCEYEARAMIDGPAPVIFPGDPAVFPRPDLRGAPPGLPLKYGITLLKYPKR